MVDTSDLDYIKQEVMKDVRKDFVDKDDCNTIQLETNKILAEYDKRILLNAHDLKAIKNLLWVIATAVIGQIITMIFLKIMG